MSDTDEPKSAEIFMHPAGWNPRAALEYSRNEVDDKARAILISWIDGAGRVRWSSAGKNSDLAWMLLTAQNYLMR